MNLSLRGPEDLRSSLRGASELLYPSEETLRRSLAAESAEKEALRSQATASWLGLQPTLGFSDYAQDPEIMCGVLDSGHEQGFLAGTMARNVLRKGVAAGTQAVRLNQKGFVFLNLKAAERFGLTVPYEIIEAAEVLAQ